MRKFTLFIASLFLAVGAMAQTFVEPQVGKFYKIKGNHSTNPWLTAVVENGGIDVSSDEANAGIFIRIENGLQEVSTGKYIGTSNNQITLVTTADETLIEAADGGRFYIKTGGRYLYNNQPDYTREAGNLNAAGPNDTKWGFIEVDYDDLFNNKVFALESYMDYIYCLTDGNTNIYTNGSFSGVADTRALWMPEIVKVGVYKIKNVHTGLYIGATQHNSSVQMSETPGNYEIATAVGSETAQDGKYYIKVLGQNACMHSTSATAKGWEGGGLGNQYVFTEITGFSHTLNVGEIGYATLCLGFDAKIPEINGDENGVFIVTTSAVAGNVHLTKVEGVLPANTAVIVKAPKGTYEFAYSTDALTDVNGNLLLGTLYNKNIADEAYVLNNGANGIGFYGAILNKDGNTAFLNNANKAYLPMNAVPNKSAQFYGFDWEGTTGVEKVEIRNEKEEIYDLAGRRVENVTAPGIYIINGKKVLVK